MAENVYTATYLKRWYLENVQIYNFGESIQDEKWGQEKCEKE